MAINRNPGPGANGRSPGTRARSRGTDLNRALINAVSEGRVKRAEQLIAAGADVNFRNRQGETPLTFAAAWNQPQTLKLLLLHGADPNIADRTGGTALMLAAQHGTVQMVSALLRSNANPALTDAAGNSALDHVCWRPRGSESSAIARLLKDALGRRRKAPLAIS